VEKFFSTEFETYPKSIGIGESSVLSITTKTSALGCLATNLRITPRVDSSGKPIVSISGNEIISVCPGEEKESHFVITSNDSLSERYTYYNLADIYTFLGEQKTIDLKIDPREDDYSKLNLQLSAQTVEAGERIKFSVMTDSPYKVYSNLLISGNELLTSKLGSYYIIAATNTGQVVKKDIEVRKNLRFKIKNIQKPSLVKCGEKFNVTFTIENLGENYFKIETQQSDELRFIPTQRISVDESEKTVSLETQLDEECTGKEQFLNILVNDQRIFEKIETERPTDFFEDLVNFFKSIFNSILELF